MLMLVVGANGFIGRALSLELAERGYDVRCAVRDVSGQAGLPGKLVGVGEIDSHTNWEAALAGVDTIIHLAARVHVMRETTGDPLTAFRIVNVAGTERLAQVAAEKGVRRIVYVSSIGVNGYSTDSTPFTETSITAPYSPYTVSKYEAENALLNIATQTGLEAVIIRPPLVYGPNNPGNIMRLLKLVQYGLPLPLASVTNRRSMVYLQNLVDALIVSCVHPKAAGHTYLISDDHSVSTAQLVRDIARLMGRRAQLWPFPPALLRMAGKVTGKSEDVERLIGSLVIDSTKIHEELEWTAPFAYEQGLAETVHWFRGL